MQLLLQFFEFAPTLFRAEQSLPSVLRLFFEDKQSLSFSNLVKKDLHFTSRVDRGLVRAPEFTEPLLATLKPTGRLFDPDDGLRRRRLRRLQSLFGFDSPLQLSLLVAHVSLGPGDSLRSNPVGFEAFEAILVFFLE